MNKDGQLKQIVNDVCGGTSSAVLISVNKDGSLNVRTEKKSDYSFIVYEEKCNFGVLVDKLKELGYSIDLDTYRGLIRGGDVIKVDVTNKAITRPMIVSPNHYVFLREIDSILASDVINSFEELVVHQNKELANSLRQENPEARAYLDRHYRRTKNGK